MVIEIIEEGILYYMPALKFGEGEATAPPPPPPSPPAPFPRLRCPYLVGSGKPKLFITNHQ